jgi:very-short-patch-repair endonuclease
MNALRPARGCATLPHPVIVPGSRERDPRNTKARQERARIFGEKTEEIRSRSHFLARFAGLRKPFACHGRTLPDAGRFLAAARGAKTVPATTELEKIHEIGLHAALYLPKILEEISEIYSCESPIERLMLCALYSKLHILSPLPVEIGQNGFDAVAGIQSQGLVTIYPQAIAGRYRIDFLIYSTIWAEFKLAIECDGHDFHERTKEQAARDRARDRELQALGLHVLRFTGSEIWKSPVNCAAEVGEHILRLLGGTQ